MAPPHSNTEKLFEDLENTEDLQELQEAIMAEEQGSFYVEGDYNFGRDVMEIAAEEQKPNFPDAKKLLSDDPLMKLLFDRLVLSIDKNNACSVIKAENPKNDNGSSRNAWYLVFHDAFGQHGFALMYKTPTANDRVSNFKDKIVNKVWPLFSDTIENKHDNDLTTTEKTCREHIRLYNKTLENAKNELQRKAANQRNFQRIEKHMGVGSRGSQPPNTSLILEPPPQGHPGAVPPTGQPGAVPPTTPGGPPCAVGIGGYNAPPGAVSPFDTVIFKLLGGLLGQPTAQGGLSGGTSAATASTVLPASTVTPIGPPPLKKAKTTRFRFTRKDGGTTHCTDVSNRDLNETLKSLKHRCARTTGDKVFKFPPAEREAILKTTKVFLVNVGGEWKEDYETVKKYSVEQILEGLSEDKRAINPIPLEFQVVDNSQKMDDLEILDSE